MKNFIYIILSFIIWSTYSIILNKININPIAFTMLTTFIGFISISAYIFLKKINIKIERKFLLPIIILTFLFLCNAITFFYSYQLTTVSNAIFSHYLAPIFVSIFSIIILKEKIEKITIIALFIAIFGMFFIFSTNNKINFHNNDINGIILGIISALCYGLSVVIAKSVIKRLDFLVLMFYQGLFTSFFLIIGLLFRINFFQINKNMLYIIIIVGITHSFIAPILYLKGLEKIKAQFAGLLGYTEVVCSILLGIFFLKELPSFLTLIGGFLIVCSGGMVILYGKNN